MLLSSPEFTAALLSSFELAALLSSSPEPRIGQIWRCAIVAGICGIDAIVAGVYGNVTAIDHNAFSFQSFVAFFNKDRSAMNDGVELRMETVITGVYGDGSVIDNDAAGCMEAVLFCLDS